MSSSGSDSSDSDDSRENEDESDNSAPVTGAISSILGVRAKKKKRDRPSPTVIRCDCPSERGQAALAKRANGLRRDQQGPSVASGYRRQCRCRRRHHRPLPSSCSDERIEQIDPIDPIDLVETTPDPP
jgi:hypothetical protein